MKSWALAKALGLKTFTMDGKLFFAKAVRVSSGAYRVYRQMKREFGHAK
jgi:hypothetical protein